MIYGVAIGFRGSLCVNVDGPGACRQTPREAQVVLKGPRNRLTETDVSSGIREVSRRNISRGIPFPEERGKREEGPRENRECGVT